MTLPRELTLVDSENGTPVLSSKVVEEIDNIAGEWSQAVNGKCVGGSAYEMVVSLDSKEHKSFTVGNDAGEYVNVEVSPEAGKVILSRTSTSGAASFNTMFSIPTMSAAYDTSADALELHVYVDNSSVEILSADGRVALTALVFPSVPYDRVFGVDEVSYRPLSSIW